MRVLHVLDHSLPYADGYGYRASSLIKALNAKGIDTLQVTGVAHDQFDSDIENVGGLDFIRTQKGKNPFVKIPALGELSGRRKLRKNVEQILKDNSVDIIHVHGPAHNVVAVSKIAKQNNIPIHYDYNPYDLFDVSVETKMILDVKSISVPTEAVKSDLIKRGANPEKITIIHNAVADHESSSPSEEYYDLREKLNFNNMIVFGYIGMFEDHEGVDILIRSMRSIMLREPNACLLLVGDGEYDEELKMLASKKMLGDRVVFTGYVPHWKISQYFEQIDIFVSPRKQSKTADMVEPQKLKEAMAAGKLILASDVDGHADLIKEKETGFLFEAGNPIAIAEKYEEMMALKEGWGQIRENAKEFILKNRQMDDMTEKYIDLYKRVCGEWTK